MRLLPFVLAVSLGPALALAQNQKLVVHEWGTFTSLQNEAGQTLGAITSEDEPLPSFTYDIDHLLVLKKNNLPAQFYQGAPASLPRVTLRLETPVIYFYPPAGSKLPLALDVNVAFRGGWLTQFYPGAIVDAPGAFSVLTPATVGKLSWRGLKVGVPQNGPKTTEHVWTAPRGVRVASLATTNGECEKFLFYRGVGNVDAPLRVVRDDTANQLSVFGQTEGWTGSSAPQTIRRLWLASFRADGSTAFRKLDSVTVGKDLTNSLLTTAATFRDQEYRAANLGKLRTDMRAALIEDGLFADEADALLNTWELSYFKSAGLRLFFLVPRAWTDERLPLDISVSSEIQRVMVGRIELVTPEQRKLLGQLASAPTPQKPWATRGLADGKTVLRGTMPVAYRDLGRFRNALLLDELQRHATTSLQTFVLLNGLDNYRVEE
jgi:hypothetical protein